MLGISTTLTIYITFICKKVPSRNLYLSFKRTKYIQPHVHQTHIHIYLYVTLHIVRYTNGIEKSTSVMVVNNDVTSSYVMKQK